MYICVPTWIGPINYSNNTHSVNFNRLFLFLQPSFVSYATLFLSWNIIRCTSSNCEIYFIASGTLGECNHFNYETGRNFGITICDSRARSLQAGRYLLLRFPYSVYYYLLPFYSLICYLTVKQRVRLRDKKKEYKAVKHFLLFTFMKKHNHIYRHYLIAINIIALILHAGY